MNINNYLSLNYHKRLYQDEEGDWIVEVDDLPGCIADGKTPDEAIDNLRHAMTSWIRSRLEAGLPVPEPSGAEEYSGRILVRMPKSLHRRLSLQAKAEGVSLNQYLVSLLADASARTTLASRVIVQNLSYQPTWFPLENVDVRFVSMYRWWDSLYPNNCASTVSFGALRPGQAATMKQLPALPVSTETA